MKRRHITFFILPIILLGCTALGQELKVCSDSKTPFLDFKNNQPSGIEYDLLSGFAKDQGRTLKFTDFTDFAKVWVNLDRGDCDIVAALVTRTVEREKKYDFSLPYFPVRLVLVTPMGKRIDNLAELKGKKVLVTPASNYEEVMKRVEGVSLLYQHGHAKMAERTLAGDADAFVCDTALVGDILRDVPGLHIALVLSEREYYAFPMRKGSPLHAPLDAYLKKIKQDGTYEAILKRYMDEETVRLVLTD